MSKVIKSDKNITPSGEINFIYYALSLAGIDKFIYKTIGCRSVFAKYSYSEALPSLFGNMLIQGSFISDLTTFKDKYLD